MINVSSPYFVLRRMDYESIQTPGILYFMEPGEAIAQWCSLEAGWKNNIGGCVREGVYVAVREYSDKFGMDLWELYNTAGRSECKIHWGNFSRNYDGCIGVGKTFADIDKDGFRDITDTKNTVFELLDLTKQYKFLPFIITGPHLQFDNPVILPPVSS